MNRDLRATINQNPKLTIVLLLSLFALAGIIIALTYYKTPLISPRTTPRLKTPADTDPGLETPVPSNDTPTPASKIFKCDKQDEWCDYTNKKYNYFFKVPLDHWVNNLTQTGLGGTNIIEDDFVKIYVNPENQNEYDFFTHITVNHTDTEFFNPPEGTDLIEWLYQEAYTSYFPNHPIPKEPNLEIDGLPAVYIDMPSPQSGPQTDVHVLKGGKLFQINSMNVGDPEARNFFLEFLAIIHFAE